MSGRKQKDSEAPRTGRARRVSELLPDAGRASFRKFGFVQHAIVSRWAEIVGVRYAGVSAPESIRFPQGKRANGTLTLTVAGAHAPMMQHVLPEIVERVNRFFGYPAVEKVAIRQGVVIKATPKPARPELQPVPVELGDSLRAVGDPELRAVLESLARGIATSETIPVIGRVK
ncbi:DUF721 domain-containing protein [Sphingomonas tabacisoli]|uniref:DUF721 domain-containing protein n=1 Tax=Sphingomonas tabacisoli TaxID=2249466 RepID=A0ABW4I5T8_9SPHN